MLFLPGEFALPLGRGVGSGDNAPPLGSPNPRQPKFICIQNDMSIAYTGQASSCLLSVTSDGLPQHLIRSVLSSHCGVHLGSQGPGTAAEVLGTDMVLLQYCFTLLSSVYLCR